MEEKEKRSKSIREEAKRLGFSDCGISRARFLDRDTEKLTNWLNRNNQADMHYLEKEPDKRADPRRLVPGARTVISVILNYFPHELQKDPSAPKISRYALGPDYHRVMKTKLKRLLDHILNTFPGSSGRVFTDTAPILEKAWARESGLGWTGRNSLLLSPGYGSYFFIGEVVTDLELEYCRPMEDRCGACRKCIEACPTGAIREDRSINAGRCISYLTIEKRGWIPERFRKALGNKIFGCDICQEVCPWNRDPEPHHEPALKANPELLRMKKEDWYGLTRKDFNRIFSESEIKRVGYNKLRSNLMTIRGA